MSFPLFSEFVCLLGKEKDGKPFKINLQTLLSPLLPTPTLLAAPSAIANLEMDPNRSSSSI